MLKGSIFPPSKDRWYWPSIELNSVPTLVPCQTLDSFCRTNGIEKCDFLFLDMQGAELGMLMHSPDILSKVSVILTEVEYEQIYENCHLYPELKQFLESQGFEEIEHLSRHQSWGDALFVRK